MARTTQVRLDRASNEIVTTRLLDAPRELVWRAFTDHEQISAWWGPVGFRTTTLASDVRTGGSWTHVMRGPDGRRGAVGGAAAVRAGASSTVGVVRRGS